MESMDFICLIRERIHDVPGFNRERMATMTKKILKWEYFQMPVTIGSVLTAMAYAGRSYQLQRLNDEVVIEHYGSGGAILIRHGNTVVTECEPNDGEI
jgi:hypothetical protein